MTQSSSVNARPIGIFDSGVGGLTVLSHLTKKFPRESFVYLGDTARLPYGTKSQGTIQKYVEQNINFLQTHDVKCIVIACSSASSALESLRIARPDLFKALPIFGVIEAGAREAIKTTRNLKVGVIGTQATVRAEVYKRSLKKLNPACEVFQKACALFVPLVEENWWEGDVVEQIIREYLQSLKDEGIDTLILGCTHFPVLQAAFEKFLGDKVRCINSADGAAIDLAEHLLAVGKNSNIISDTNSKLFLTDESPHFKELAHRLLGTQDPLDIQHVDLIF